MSTKKGSISPLTPLPVGLFSTHSPDEGKDPHGPWARRTVLCLAVAQIALGALLIIIQTTLIAKHAYMEVPGAGIGCGIFFIITGIVGIAASKNPHNCLILTMMAMCILSAVGTTLLFSQGTIGIVVDNDQYLRREHQEDAWYSDDELRYCFYDDVRDEETAHPKNTSLRGTTPTENNNRQRRDEPGRKRICVLPDIGTYHSKYGLLRLMLSLHGMMLGFALIEVIVALVASCLACRALCACCYQQDDSDYHHVTPSSTMEKPPLESPATSPADFTPLQGLYPISIPFDMTPKLSRRGSPASQRSQSRKQDKDVTDNPTV